MINPYSVLGLEESASLAEVKAQYRKLVLKWHPDRNKSPHAEEKLKKILEAYLLIVQGGYVGSEKEKDQSNKQYRREDAGYNYEERKKSDRTDEKYRREKKREEEEEERKRRTGKDRWGRSVIKQKRNPFNNSKLWQFIDLLSGNNKLSWHLERRNSFGDELWVAYDYREKQYKYFLKYTDEDGVKHSVYLPYAFNSLDDALDYVFSRPINRI
ncbi:MAG: DnaJ domain-containing protein [Thaumarchaeota archaeon]|nr:DnaJ domain-containing protein [Nitrososphaerota archaeon]